ncbi:MAG: phosphoadenosine phosphosulfate reductase family protein [Dictyoglomaceae bacterium]
MGRIEDYQNRKGNFKIQERNNTRMRDLGDKKIFVSISGGADSTATALLLYEKRYDFELVFCDTGVEFPETYEVIYKLADITGKNLIILGRENGSLLDYIKKYHYIPDKRRRFCTRVLKSIPMEKFEKGIKKKGIKNGIIAVGLRFDEQNRVGFTKTLGVFNKIYPLVEERYTREDTFKKCRDYGLLNPLYEWRSRVACYCCPFQRKSEWIGLLERYPDLYKRVEEVEEEIIALKKKNNFKVYTFRQDISLKQLRENYEKQLSF